MKHATLVIGLLCGLVAAKPTKFNSWSVGQAVSTTSGRVVGHAAQDVPDVSEYLGIPFAAAPVGALRFQPPVPYNGSAVINGSAFSPGCMQPSDTEYPQSEDCLSVNVWTKPQVGERKKAVLVWVHGGAYSYGSAREDGYSGRFFANDSDVVLMSINYRLGIFGFPGNPATTANLGLLDMRLAMEWIRDNAQKFGGDPSRISVFGQSAGAGMADFYAYAYASDPIANGFVLQSATVVGFPALSRNYTSTRWFRLAAAVGCGTGASNSTNPKLVTDCMKNRTTEQIFGAFGPEETGVGSTPAFGPGVDDILVFEDYTDRRAAEAGYLIGDNANEAGLFRSMQPNRSDAYWNDFNFRYYTCGDAIRISQAVNDGMSAWRYRYFGDFPNLAISTNPPSGAYHGAELPPLFGTLPQTPPSTAVELATAEFLQGAWTTFAKDTSSGLLGYAGGWPIYDPAELTLAQIARDNQTGTNLGLGNSFDGICSSLPAIPPS
ncbi:carboxylesterase [Colletotrichum scovillei]|uniref:Carboxylic ester hydrolase n=1 Tax=Colletotrichum scovillei TaxID=1209932 RepID=A0A9P7UHT7_9PEZI|nr:carboxylesterase [Colletotrichum scovillei]KAG7072153.1 carboxylesterase [Colletotrichum scovillei]KAG7080397.1 carboxylesterase [Colletotrichum scovillei]